MMKKLVLVCLLILGVVFGTSCKGSTTPEPPPAKHPPDITNFTVTPESCLYKEADVPTPVLSWNVTGAASVAIDQGIGAVAASGTRLVSWMDTKTWVLTASNNDGTVSKSCTFTVVPRAYFVLAHQYLWWTDDNCPSIRGEVLNQGNLTGYNVVISFQAINAYNVILDTAKGFPADLGNISPEQRAAFEAIFFNLNRANWPQVTQKKYEITWLNRTTGVRVRQVGNI